MTYIKQCSCMFYIVIILYLKGYTILCSPLKGYIILCSPEHFMAVVMAASWLGDCCTASKATQCFLAAQRFYVS